MVKSCRGKKLKPFTPVRKLFVKLDLLKSSKALGSRRPQNGSNNRRNISRTENTPECEQAIPPMNGLSPSVPAPTSRPGLQSSNLARVALQNEDPMEDVVVITKLDNIPFCCHEDLLTMSRDQLVTVARCLNAKLPAAMQIDVSHRRLGTFIRHSIELVVGLRRIVPPAPKAVKLQSNSKSNTLDFDMSPLTSPLATRIRKYDRFVSPGSLRLARLDEEDEDSMVLDRPVKRRKLPALIHDTSDVMRSPNTTTSSTSLPHDRLIRPPRRWISSSASLTSQRVLRSYSRNFPHRMEDTRRPAFSTINTSRFHYPSEVKNIKPDNNRSSVAIPFHQKSFLTAKLTREVSTCTIYPDENDHDASNKGGLPESTPTNLTGQCERRSEAGAEAEEGMTSSIGGMSMTVSGSAMEVCID